jgi:hypothetical protein
LQDCDPASFRQDRQSRQQSILRSQPGGTGSGLRSALHPSRAKMPPGTGMSLITDAQNVVPQQQFLVFDLREEGLKDVARIEDTLGP